MSNGISREHNVSEATSILKRFTLKGKKAVVTGAAGGIGRSTAAAFAELGADVAIVDIPSRLDESKAIAQRIKEKHNVNTMSLGTDVSNETSVKEMVSNIVKEFGTIDVVHSNAGISGLNDCPDMPFEQWKKIIDINLTGIMLVDVNCASVMISHKHKGSIINTASMSGHIVNPPRADEGNMVAYTTSKAGVIHLTKSLALNYVKHGIRVNSISPGYIWSGIHEGYDQKLLDYWTNSVPIKRFGSLDDITGIVAFMATDLAAYMVGSDVIVDGGFCII